MISYKLVKISYKFVIPQKKLRNVRNTLFLALFVRLIPLLGETHVDLTTLYGIHF